MKVSKEEFYRIINQFKITGTLVTQTRNVVFYNEDGEIGKIYKSSGKDKYVLFNHAAKMHKHSKAVEGWRSMSNGEG